MILKDKVAVIYGANLFSPGATWHPPKLSPRLRELVVDLEERSRDTDRLMTILNPVLVSTKKIAKADFTVGV